MADSGGEKENIAENKAGAAPTGDALRHSRPSSVNKGGRRRVRPLSVDATPVNAHTLHWFAYLGPEPTEQPTTTQPGCDHVHHSSHDELSDEENEDSRRSTNFDADNEQGGSRERPATDERLRHVRDRQQEERQRRLEELRAQALAAQRFREQKEEERRKRIEEMRLRDNDRRSQVEERKKAIWEADRDRREAILRKNQEREARIETKRRNDRSNIVFAFGSSTPRMLEPADTGGSFWGHRRATSTTNVTFTAAPLTRRSSERELDGSKKRATSAGGLDRQPGDDEQTDGSQPAGVIYQRTVVRRRTDLVPTIPSPRVDSNSALLHGSRGSLHHHGRSPGGLRSGEMTPNQSSTSSRPGSALSQQNGGVGSPAAGGVVTRRPISAPRKPRPASIAVTGVSADEAAANKSSSRHNVNGERPKSTIVEKDGASKPPLPKVHAAPRKSVPSKPETPKRTTTEKISRPSSVKASPRITPKATPLQSPGADSANTMLKQSISEQQQTSNKIEAPPVANNENNQQMAPPVTNDQTPAADAQTKMVQSTDKIATVSATADGQIAIETNSQNNSTIVMENTAKVTGQQENVVTSTTPNVVDSSSAAAQKPTEAAPAATQNSNKVENATTKSTNEDKASSDTLAPTENGNAESVDMSASMIAKIRITTEEEAKAALAERRRVAREEAERQAEQERRRQQEAEEAELRRQREEEELQRRLEEETLRLAAEQRLAEEQRLLQAIEETRQREEEEAKRREEEARQRAEREEQEKKAREEAERQREEMAKRLEQEEKEREARRKRVEAIMLRTRSKPGAAGQNVQPTSNNKTENDDKSPSDDTSSKTNPEQDTVDDSTSRSVTSQEESDRHDTFDQSVTDKENALFNSSAALVTKNSTLNNVSPAVVTNNGFQSLDIVNKNNNQLNGELLFKNDNDNGKQSNGHRNGPDVMIDNKVEQNNTTNALLDLTDFDSLANSTATNLKNAMQLPPHHSELITNMMTAGVDNIIDLVDTTNSNLPAAVQQQQQQQNMMPPAMFATTFTDNNDGRDLSLL